MIKQILSTQKNTTNTPSEALSSHDAQLNEKNMMSPPPRRSFFSAMKRLYWFGIIFILLSSMGAGIYYFPNTFVKQISIQKHLPQLQGAAHKIFRGITVLVEGARSIPLQLERFQAKKGTKNIAKQVEKPITDKITPSAEVTTYSDKIVSLEKALDTIHHQMDDYNKQIHKLDKQLNDIDTRLQHLEAKSRQNTVVEPSTTYNTTKTAARSKYDASSPQNIPTNQKHAVTSLESIHAIIPGRAWLNSQDGQIISVCLGSNVPDYGVVHLIDPHRGFVQFNSGKIIALNTKEY